MKMDGKVAVVTGAAQGMGRESAILFAERGAKVVVADVDETRGEQTIELIRAAGGEAVFARTDVTVEADVEAMVAHAVETFGGLDYAHNNAGGGGGFSVASVPELAEADWDGVVDLNLKSAFLCMKHELLHMLEHGGGAIVNTASAAGYRSSVAHASYVSAKAGLLGLTKHVAFDMASRGVRVNALCPGVVATDRAIAQRGLEATEELARKVMPLPRALAPREMAYLAVWLCSDEASALTGAIVAADGGMSAI
jgi:NAD(P)-dependent dehydrogenase (short-subunit alcohol dehydrogenase family)